MSDKNFIETYVYTGERVNAGSASHSVLVQSKLITLHHRSLTRGEETSSALWDVPGTMKVVPESTKHIDNLDEVRIKLDQYREVLFRFDKDKGAEKTTAVLVKNGDPKTGEASKVIEVPLNLNIKPELIEKELGKLSNLPWNQTDMKLNRTQTAIATTGLADLYRAHSMSDQADKCLEMAGKTFTFIDNSAKEPIAVDLSGYITKPIYKGVQGFGAIIERHGPDKANEIFFR